MDNLLGDPSSGPSQLSLRCKAMIPMILQKSKQNSSKTTKTHVTQSFSLPQVPQSKKHQQVKSQILKLDKNNNKKQNQQLQKLPSLYSQNNDEIEHRRELNERIKYYLNQCQVIQGRVNRQRAYITDCKNQIIMIEQKLAQLRSTKSQLLTQLKLETEKEQKTTINKKEQIQASLKQVSNTMEELIENFNINKKKCQIAEEKIKTYRTTIDEYQEAMVNIEKCKQN